MKTKRFVRCALPAILLTTVGCANLEPKPVRPWERGVLARQDMLVSPHPVVGFLDEHIYFSKEAASGGKGVGGGGCGCN